MSAPIERARHLLGLLPAAKQEHRNAILRMVAVAMLLPREGFSETKRADPNEMLAWILHERGRGAPRDVALRLEALDLVCLATGTRHLLGTSQNEFLSAAELFHWLTDEHLSPLPRHYEVAFVDPEGAARRNMTVEDLFRLSRGRGVRTRTRPQVPYVTELPLDAWS